MDHLDNSGNRDNKSAPDAIQPAKHRLDEVYLGHYIRILWNRKYYIISVSILAALIVGMALFFWPKQYQITYLYDVSDWDLSEKDYTVFVTRFYSEQNIGKIVSRLQEKGFEPYAQKLIAASKRPDGFSSFLKIIPIPPHFDTNGNHNAQADLPEAAFLKIILTGASVNDLSGISDTVRRTLEKKVLLNRIQDYLSAEMRVLNQKLAKVEQIKYRTMLNLKTMRTALEKLRAVSPIERQETGNNVVLQFEINDRNKYLPLGYQIQALQSEIIDLEKTIEANDAYHQYYDDLLKLVRTLRARLNEDAVVNDTFDRYLSFLRDLVDGREAGEVKNFLRTYLRKTEHQISMIVPVSEGPYIHTIAPKGIFKKAGMVFVIVLLVSAFVSLLAEGMEKR